MKQQHSSSERASTSQNFYDKDLFFGGSSSSNLKAKFGPKKNNKELGAKYSPDCCRIPNASDLGRVSARPKVFVPPETHYSGAGPVTTVLLAVHEL